MCKTVEEIKSMNIFQKMATISAEITRVGKNLSIQAGKESYKAVGEGDVLAAVKPLEETYRVYSYPAKRELVGAETFTKVKTYNNQTTESTTLFMRIKTTYRFVNIDNPAEFVDIDTYGDGVDPQDKAPGKAMTYADKYALLKAYKITTGDDPDQNGSEDMGKGQKGDKEQNTEPSFKQLEALKKVKRSLADVAKYFKIDEKAVTAKHVTDYIAKIVEYQQQKKADAEAKKSAEVESEAEKTFPKPSSDEPDYDDPEWQ